MKNTKEIMAIISLFAVLAMVIFIKKGVSPEKLQKALDTIEHVTVKVQSYPGVGSAIKKEISYSVHTKECFIHWEFTEYEIKNEKRINFRLRYPSEKKCELSFKQQLPTHKRILERAFIDWDKTKLTSFGTPSLQVINRGGEWNRNLIKAALKSELVADFKKNYPNHKSKLSSNDIVVKLINENNIVADFKQLFVSLGLEIELTSCEKVFNANKERATEVGFELPENIKSIFYDAGTFGFKVLSSGT